MDKELVREAYKLAIADGYSHEAISRATGVGVSSLKNFYADETGFGPASMAKLEPWLAERGFMDKTWASKDPFRGLIAITNGMLRDLEAAASFADKREILENFLRRMNRHPFFSSLKNPGEKSEK